MKRLLIVGAVPDYKNNLQFGGATVLTKLLLDYLSENQINFDFAQTNKYSDLKSGKANVVRSTIYFLWAFFSKLRKADIVMFNFSDHGVTTLFPILSTLSRKIGKKIVLRKFGGSFDIYLQKISPKKRNRALKAIEKSDLILFETKSGIAHLKSLIDVEQKIIWFPNVRKPSSFKRNPDTPTKKIVFMGHICDEKGVGDVLKISKQLNAQFSFHLYGAIKEEKYQNFNWDKYGATYHGEITSDEVPQILSESSLLLLTSYREGYPGILIEALSVGLPVVTTNVGGIPEMITDSIEGLIICPGDIDSACKKILSLTQEEYAKMSFNAHQTYLEKFDADSVNQRILQRILTL